MAQIWLLQALYASLLSSTGNTNVSPTSGATGSGLTVIANTTYGQIVGAVDNTAQPTIFRYLGVPFAKPPIGDLRFKAPLKPDPWTGVKRALEPSPQCWQTGIPLYPSSFPNSEDCLYLNIYTPARESSAGLLPVMVWIHGGGYVFGTAAEYNGTTLARDGGVVVVTINYRLDVFGFLSTEDDEMPGNYGILDQIEALRWVRDNIERFGGDPNSVTIFGESAGSGSVSLLVLSPLARGLFSRAIMESGVSLSPWAYEHPTQRLAPVYGARLVGVGHGCQHASGGSKAFVNCLRGVEPESLLKSSATVSSVLQGFSLWLVPRVETTFGVLPDEPIKLLTKGDFAHVDTIRGFNSHEMGFIRIRNNTVDVQSRSDFLEAMRENLRPWAFPGLDNLLAAFDKLYVNATTNDPSFFVKQASKATSDYFFASPTVREITLAALGAPEKNHFLYRFDYRNSYSTQADWIGAIHADELRYVFGLGQVPQIEPKDDSLMKNTNDKAMADKMIALWTNFAKNGSPSAPGLVNWEAFTNSKPRMMTLNSMSTIGDFSGQKRLELFDEVLRIFDAYTPASNVIG